MMKKFNLFLGGLMAIAFTACTNDDLLPEGNSNAPFAEETIITAYTPSDNSASSRIAQGDYQVGNTIPLTWEASTDKISVINDGTSITFTSIGGNQFSSVGNYFVAGDDPNFYGVYPAITDGTMSHTAVPFDLSNQTEADAYLMYAHSLSGTIFQFHHAAAYLKATFPETLKNTTATITLTVPEGVYTQGTIDLSNGTLSGTSGNTITKEVTFGESTEVWFAIPPMATGDKTLNFTIKTADSNYRATLAGSAEKAIEAGNYYSATITITEALNVSKLPDGGTFLEALNTAVGSETGINSIRFEAKSDRSTTNGTQIGSSTAYAIVDGDCLYVYTADDVFEFHQICSGMFKGLVKVWLRDVQMIDFGDCIDTSNVTNMREMFSYCETLTSLDLSSFDTSKVTNMIEMFSNCKALTTLDLRNFDTSNVTNMSWMFYVCKALTTLDLSSFDTSYVTNMSYMFYLCKELTTLDLCNFTFNATSYGSMFDLCTKLNNVYVENTNDRDILRNGNTYISNTDNIEVHTTHGAS